MVNIINKLDDVSDINKVFKESGITKDVAIKALKASDIADTLSDTVDAATEGAEAMTNVQAATKGLASSADEVTGLGLAFEGLKTKIAGIAPTLATVGTAMVALGIAFDIYNKQQHKFTSAQEKAGESASSYQEEASKLQSLNSELDNTKARIQELQSLQKAGTITFAQETELAKLQETNAELERQVELQKDLVQTKLKISAQDAKKASETKKTFTEDMQESLGEIGGFFAGLFGNTTITDANGNPVNAKDVWKKAETNNGDSSIEGKIKKDIEDINNLKSQLEDAYDDGNLKKIESLQEKINTAKGSLYENAEIVQGWLDQSVDENGVAAKGVEEAVDGYREILNDVANIDASEAEKSLNNLETFFSSTSGKTIKKYLDDIIKNGGSAEDALAAFEATGLNLSELGIDSEHFVRYFEDIEKAAKKAADATTKFGTLEEYEAALESENAGDDYLKIAEGLKKTKELYDKGLVGTDDFKSYAKMLSPTGKTDDKNFIENYKNLKKYFTEDESGSKKFLNELSKNTDKAGQSFATLDKETGQWKINIKDTTEAAKALGMGIVPFESLLGRLQDYGFDIDFRSAVQDLTDVQTALGGFDDLLSKMEDGERKDALKLQVDGWKEQLPNWEKDLSKLDTDVALKIKLEYSLAEIQAKIDEFKNSIDWGNATSENYAGLLAGNDQYISKAESALGFDKEGFKAGEQYVNVKANIKDLQEQLKNATSEEEKIEIQAEIENLQEIQKNLLDAFSDAHPEINADSSLEEIQTAWNDFVNSATGKNILLGISVDDSKAIEKIEELSNKEIADKIVNVVGVDHASEVIEIWQGLEADPKFAELSAEDKATEELSNKEIADKIVNVVGVDHASEVIEIWQGLEADPKFAELSAEDKATTILNLWNAAEADPKFAELSAEDKATVILNAYNNLSIDDKKSLISQSGGETTKGVAAEADPKFAELSAEDKATVILNAYNNLSIDDKKSLISQSGGETTKGVAASVKAAINSIPGSKTVTITTKNITEHITKFITDNKKHSDMRTNPAPYKGGFNGTAHANGTVRTVRRGNAFASGDWGANKTEKALVGELGQETIKL